MAGNNIGNVYAELSVRDKMSLALNKVGRKLGELGVAAMKSGAVLSGALAAGLVVGSKRIITMGANLDHLRSQTGLSISSLIKLGQAYKDNGKDASSVGKDIGKMQRAIFEAAKAPGSTIDYFKDIGLSASALVAMSPEQQFFAIGNAIKGLKNPTEQAALAMQIFGRSGGQLLTVFKGSDLKDVEASLGRMPEIMQRFGGAMERVDTLWGRLPNKSDQFFTGFTSGVIGQVLPSLEAINKWDFTEVGEKLGNALGTAIQGIKDGSIFDQFALESSSAVLQFGENLKDTITAAFTAGIGAARSGFQDAAKWLGDIITGGSEAENQAKRDRDSLVKFGFKPLSGESPDVSGPGAAWEKYKKDFSNNLVKAIGEQGPMGQLADQFKRNAEIIQTGIDMNQRISKELAEKIGGTGAGADVGEVMASIPEKTKDKFEDIKAGVNSMQARGLGMGAMTVPKEVTEQLSIQRQIRDMLKRKLNAEPEGATF